MKKKNKFDFNDIAFQPAITTNIKSRRDINPFLKYNANLPIITAPMDTVVDRTNYRTFQSNKINVCFPRKTSPIIDDYNRLEYVNSVSLQEFKDYYLSLDSRFSKQQYICIDTANGHLDDLIITIQKAKELFGDWIFLIVGNVAHPKTYLKLSNAGADAIRVGIGGGSGCTTSVHTKIHYPLASLIVECRKIKNKYDLKSLIIADGGMQNYSDIICSLGLGADIVMVGSLLNKALESCGETKLFGCINISPNSKMAQIALKWKLKLTKKYRGMSTKEVQKSWGNTILKTSEGVVRVRPVEYTLKQWVENFEDYLRSSMSYVNATNLDEFIGKVKYNFITENSFKRFNK